MEKDFPLGNRQKGWFPLPEITIWIAREGKS
jgi:hypothetical protein